MTTLRMSRAIRVAVLEQRQPFPVALPTGRDKGEGHLGGILLQLTEHLEGRPRAGPADDEQPDTGRTGDHRDHSGRTIGVQPGCPAQAPGDRLGCRLPGVETNSRLCPVSST